MFDGQVDLFDGACSATPSSDSGDEVWNNMRELRVSLFKQFTFSESLFFGSTKSLLLYAQAQKFEEKNQN